MQQIAQWLEKLGLSEYLPRFLENRVDVSVLRDLTDQDLRDLGVVLGDRRRMLRAIGELEPDQPVASQAAVAPPTHDAAERRQLTVMFCDLVGSTALSARLDPEDLRAIIGAYHRCCATLVERNGGFVAKYMGDGVLVYFGYPSAHEHDAERAVQAGLSLVDAVPKLATSDGAPLQVRVGIATGLVVVGDLIGSGEAQERGVVGETPNLAARLQAIAAPGMVVIAEGTRRLIGNLFELQDLGRQDLKGIAGPVQAFAPLRRSAVESRFEALHGAGLTALVGRDQEFDVLRRRWSQAKAGDGQMVLLSGEAGIGKSRLTAGLLGHVAAEPHACLRYFCSPQHTDSAMYPIIGEIARRAGLSRDDSPQAKLDKFDAMLAQTATSIEDATLLADMLSLPNDGRYPRLELAPSQRRQRIFEAILAQIASVAQATPVLIIFEDAHWADPTSLDLLGLLMSRIAKLRVLLLLTFRPEFEPPWKPQSQVTALVLDRLTRREVDTLIDRVIGENGLAADIRQDILDRADGIPLFVEEMTKAVIEAEGEADARRTAASIPAATAAVPVSLHASLMARLDRLGSAKEVAQIAAAIGREFSHTLLDAVARKPKAELQGALDRLINAGLLFRQNEPPHASYLFNHALVQDAAYGTLLREPRRALHARIAQTLEQEFAEVAASQPELVARHYTQADLIEKAAGFWGKAGQRSLARSALTEAGEQLTRALGQIADLPGTAASRSEQIRLQVQLANVLIHTRGHAAPETNAAFDRARMLIEQAEQLGEPLEDPLVLYSVLYGFWVVSRMDFKGDVMRKLAAQFRLLAADQKATAPVVIGHLLSGISAVLTADLATGRRQLDQAIARYDATEHAALAIRFGHDVRVSALCWRAWARWALGYPDAARADTSQALEIARDMGHAATSMYALSHTSLTLIFCGDDAMAETLIDRLVALADEKGTLFWKGYGLLLRGWIFALAGKAADAIDLMNAGIAMSRSTGATAYAPWYLANLAKTQAELGQFDEATRRIGEAMATADTTEEKWCEADIHRIAGEIALLSAVPDMPRAEAHLERALAAARQQQAKSFELRAAMSLARLWRQQGKRRQALDLLAPVSGWFSEGLNTRDLRQAKILRDELAS